MKAGLIETRSLSEQVYQVLCSRIIEGSIRYGDSLNIKRIAESLHVSSMPVREAVKRLENEGLVAIKPRSTCVVKPPTKQSILNALEMREILELYCIDRITPGVGEEDVARLRSIVERMKDVVDGAPAEEGPRGYIVLDSQFHTAVCSLARNEYVDKAYREVGLHLSMQYIYDIGVPPDNARTCREHLELLDALARRSPAALSCMKKHLQQSRRNIMEGRLFASLS